MDFLLVLIELYFAAGREEIKKEGNACRWEEIKKRKVKKEKEKSKRERKGKGKWK